MSTLQERAAQLRHYREHFTVIFTDATAGTPFTSVSATDFPARARLYVAARLKHGAASFEPDTLLTRATEPLSEAFPVVSAQAPLSSPTPAMLQAELPGAPAPQADVAKESTFTAGTPSGPARRAALPLTFADVLALNQRAPQPTQQPAQPASHDVSPTPAPVQLQPLPLQPTPAPIFQDRPVPADQAPAVIGQIKSQPDVGAPDPESRLTSSPELRPEPQQPPSAQDTPQDTPAPPAPASVEPAMASTTALLNAATSETMMPSIPDVPAPVQQNSVQPDPTEPSLAEPSPAEPERVEPASTQPSFSEPTREELTALMERLGGESGIEMVMPRRPRPVPFKAPVEAAPEAVLPTTTPEEAQSWLARLNKVSESELGGESAFEPLSYDQILNWSKKKSPVAPDAETDHQQAHPGEAALDGGSTAELLRRAVTVEPEAENEPLSEVPERELALRRPPEDAPLSMTPALQEETRRSADRQVHQREASFSRADLTSSTPPSLLSPSGGVLPALGVRPNEALLVVPGPKEPSGDFTTDGTLPVAPPNVQAESGNSPSLPAGQPVTPSILPLRPDLHPAHDASYIKDAPIHSEALPSFAGLAASQASSEPRAVNVVARLPAREEHGMVGADNTPPASPAGLTAPQAWPESNLTVLPTARSFSTPRESEDFRHTAAKLSKAVGDGAARILENEPSQRVERSVPISTALINSAGNGPLLPVRAAALQRGTTPVLGAGIGVSQGSSDAGFHQGGALLETVETPAQGPAPSRPDGFEQKLTRTSSVTSPSRIKNEASGASRRAEIVQASPISVSPAPQQARPLVTSQEVGQTASPARLGAPPKTARIYDPASPSEREPRRTAVQSDAAARDRGYQVPSRSSGPEPETNPQTKPVTGNTDAFLSRQPEPGQLLAPASGVQTAVPVPRAVPSRTVSIQRTLTTQAGREEVSTSMSVPAQRAHVVTKRDVSQETSLEAEQISTAFGPDRALQPGRPQVLTSGHAEVNVPAGVSVPPSSLSQPPLPESATLTKDGLDGGAAREQQVAVQTEASEPDGSTSGAEVSTMPTPQTPTEDAAFIGPTQLGIAGQARPRPERGSLPSGPPSPGQTSDHTLTAAAFLEAASEPSETVFSPTAPTLYQIQRGQAQASPAEPVSTQPSSSEPAREELTALMERLGGESGTEAVLPTTTPEEAQVWLTRLNKVFESEISGESTFEPLSYDQILNWPSRGTRETSGATHDNARALLEQAETDQPQRAVDLSPQRTPGESPFEAPMRIPGPPLITQDLAKAGRTAETTGPLSGGEKREERTVDEVLALAPDEKQTALRSGGQGVPSALGTTPLVLDAATLNKVTTPRPPESRPHDLLGPEPLGEAPSKHPTTFPVADVLLLESGGGETAQLLYTDAASGQAAPVAPQQPAAAESSLERQGASAQFSAPTFLSRVQETSREEDSTSPPEPFFAGSRVQLARPRTSSAGRVTHATPPDPTSAGGTPPRPVPAKRAPTQLAPSHSAASAPQHLTLQRALNQALRADQPVETLPEGVRARLAPLLGADVAGVRLLRGPEAAEATAAAAAEALAVGDAVLLAPGHDLNSPRTLGVLAHELTHVVRTRDPDFVPVVARSHRTRSAGRPADTRPESEEALAQQVEGRVRAYFKAAALGNKRPDAAQPYTAQPYAARSDAAQSDAVRRAPEAPDKAWGGLPAPWDPLPFWDTASPTPTRGAATPPGTSRPADQHAVMSAPTTFVPTMSAAASASPLLGVQAAGLERTVTDEPVSSGASNTNATSGPSAKPTLKPNGVDARANEAGPDLDQLAQQVYGLLKRRLATELRRTGKRSM